jgi:hypothetical protein
MWQILTSNSKSSCSILLSAGIIDMCHTQHLTLLSNPCLSLDEEVTIKNKTEISQEYSTIQFFSSLKNNLICYHNFESVIFGLLFLKGSLHI